MHVDLACMDQWGRMCTCMGVWVRELSGHTYGGGEVGTLPKQLCRSGRRNHAPKQGLTQRMMVHPAAARTVHTGRARGPGVA